MDEEDEYELYDPSIFESSDFQVRFPSRPDEGHDFSKQPQESIYEIEADGVTYRVEVFTFKRKPTGDEFGLDSEQTSDGLVERIKIVLAEDSIYRLTVIAPEGAEGAAIASKFFDSFRVKKRS